MYICMTYICVYIYDIYTHTHTHTQYIYLDTRNAAFTDLFGFFFAVSFCCQINLPKVKL